MFLPSILISGKSCPSWLTSNEQGLENCMTFCVNLSHRDTSNSLLMTKPSGNWIKLSGPLPILACIISKTCLVFDPGAAHMSKIRWWGCVSSKNTGIILTSSCLDKLPTSLSQVRNRNKSANSGFSLSFQRLMLVNCHTMGKSPEKWTVCSLKSGSSNLFFSCLREIVKLWMLTNIPRNGKTHQPAPLDLRSFDGNYSISPVITLLLIMPRQPPNMVNDMSLSTKQKLIETKRCQVER